MIFHGAYLMAVGFWKGNRMKGVFTAFFAALMLYGVGSVALTGAATARLLLEAAIALPGLFLGAWVGVKICDLIPERVFSWVVLAMPSAKAVVLPVTALLE